MDSLLPAVRSRCLALFTPAELDPVNLGVLASLPLDKVS
jgi:hypothetical protein